MRRSVSAVLLALLLVFTLVAACAPAATVAPTVVPTSAAPTMTLKPTFTAAAPAAPTSAPTSAPVATTVAPVAAAAATLAPTLTPKAAATTAAPAPPTAAPTRAAPAAKSLRMNSPEYGMQAFMWWRPEVGTRDLQIIRAAGFTWCKVNFGWRDIEGAAKGAFDWSRTDRIVEMANGDNVDLIVRIDHQPSWAGGAFPGNGPPDNPQDLADFLKAIATRYKGRVRAYEVWNEPNLSREWGGKLPDPGAYVKLLKLAYSALKAADPNVMVISAGLSPTGSWTTESRPDDWFLESMYVAMGGKSDGYFDVLGAHGAGYKSPPERDPAEVAANKDLGGHRAFCFRRVEDLRAIMVKNGESNKQIALLEFGWTSDPRPDSPYNWHQVSEEVKADYFVRAYRYAKANWAPWIGLMSLIYVADPDWTKDNEQYWWAITDPNYPVFKPRPAYDALKAMAK